MKAVHVVASVAEEAAGPSYSVRRLCETLAARGGAVDLVTLGPGGLRKAGGVTFAEHAQSFAAVPVLRQLRLSRSMRAALSRLGPGPAVVHNHGLWLMPNIYAARGASAAGIPLVISPRGMLSPEALAFSRARKRLFWMLLQRSALLGAGCLHATSEKERNDIRQQGIKLPVCIIPNGIDIPAPGPRPPAGAQRTLLFLGRLHPVKRVETLLASWAKLWQRHPDWRLEIAGVGDDGYVRRLRSQAEAMQGAPVAFTGPLYGSHKLDAYRRASLYVLPSASENFGITIAESLAAGTPVVTTRGTPWSGLAGKRAGWCTDHGEEALTAVLTEALSLDPETLDAMGRRGRDWMRESFSWDSVAERMEAVYRWLALGDVRPADVED